MEKAKAKGKGYTGKIKNAGTQKVDAPIKTKPAKKPVVKETGKDLRS